MEPEKINEALKDSKSWGVASAVVKIAFYKELEGLEGDVSPARLKAFWIPWVGGWIACTGVVIDTIKPAELK